MWAPRFRLFGTFIPDTENAGGSAIFIHKDLLPEGAIVAHVITCQGRDHIVNVQSGRKKLSDRQRPLRAGAYPEALQGLRLITPHWPPYPNAVGIILGEFFYL